MKGSKQLFTTKTGGHSPELVTGGDRVALTANYVDLVAGMAGTVNGISKFGILVLFDGRKEPVSIPRKLLNKKNY